MINLENEIIRLPELYKSFLVISSCIETEKGNFCAAIAMQKPNEPALLEIRENSEGEIQVLVHDIEDYAEIIDEIANKVQCNRNIIKFPTQP